jgi:hypothetical protein
MPAEPKPTEVTSGDGQSRTRKRLKLMESYGAFSDERLKDISDKIKGVTSENTPNHRSQNRSQSGESLGESLGAPIQSPIQSPDVSPNDSPIQSAQNKAVLLTESQSILYFCLKHIDGDITSLNHIAKATGISEHTLKSCLKKLRLEGIIHYGGRRNCGGRFGFTATVSERQITLRGDRNKLIKRLQRIDYHSLALIEPLNKIGQNTRDVGETDHLMDHPTDHPISHLMPSCSSSKDLKRLLQGLILEDAFQDLNPQSLIPYLDQFETTEQIQNFLDMANACITSAKTGNGKPIQNPQGFLFAQLKAGYINPPEGFKSRKVRAQEIRNQQLEAELAALRQLKEQERQLQFELFREKLIPEQLDRLEQEAQAQVKPGLGISKERQIEVAKDEIVKQWFEQQRAG